MNNLGDQQARSRGADATVLLLVGMGIIACLLSPSVALIQIQTARALPECGCVLVEGRTPWGQHRFAVLPLPMAEAAAEGTWLLSRGTPLHLAGHDLLAVRAAQPGPAIPSGVVHAISQARAGLQRQIENLGPGASSMLGATLLVVGRVVLRLAATVSLATIGAMLAWLAVGISSLSGVLVSSPPAAALASVAAIGAVLGAVYARRPGFIAELSQRAFIAAVMWMDAQRLSTLTGMGTPETSALLAVASAALPRVGVGLLGGGFLAEGLGVEGLPAGAILGASGVISHLIQPHTYGGSARPLRMPRLFGRGHS